MGGGSSRGRPPRGGSPPSRSGHDRGRKRRSDAMKRIEPIILIAALGFYALAMTSQGILPLLEKNGTRRLTRRTIDGKTVNTPKRSELEQEGRRIYIREGCWYCHSQYIRPVNRKTDKWGPVTKAARSATTC